jgi:hypothetical protein
VQVQSYEWAMVPGEVALSIEPQERLVKANFAQVESLAASERMLDQCHVLHSSAMPTPTPNQPRSQWPKPAVALWESGF